MPPTILLTRPKVASERFARALKDRLGGAVAIMIAPLTRIDPVDTPLDLEGIRGLIFTSRNGVEAYLRATWRRDLPCIAVGDATAQQVQQAGMKVQSCRGDAEALIAQIATGEDRGPVLHVRGRHTRGDVAKRLSDAGHPTREVVLYDQVALVLTEEAIDLLQRESPVIVPLFSPRSAAQFVAAHHGAAPLFVGAMSEAVAEVTVPLKAVRTGVAERPDAAAMLDLVAGLLDAASRLEAGHREE